MMLRRFIPHFFVQSYHWLSAIIADFFYGRPSRKLIVIGITGTNGKTSVAHFAATILEVAGKRVGLISTIAITIGGHTRTNETKMTSLKNCWQLQRLLHAMVRAGDMYAIVETTSHALDQYRVHRIRYDVAVVTNVTHEHLDYHKTLLQYRKAKERLFSIVAHRRTKMIDGAYVPRITIANADDPSCEQFLRYASDRRIAYGMGDRPRSVPVRDYLHARVAQLSSNGSAFLIDGATVHLSIPGKFSMMNALAAFAIVRTLGIDLPIAFSAIQSLRGIPGRLEFFDAGQPFRVMIDYAVTPDAFEKLAELVRNELLQKGARWWWVFGATGERDRTKRPILGEIAGRAADAIVLTNEDPFHEDPEGILDEVEAGVKQSGKEKEKNYWRIIDRRAAIRYALEHAKPGDVVTITGKGAETAMAIGDARIPWNERQIVSDLLREVLRSCELRNPLFPSPPRKRGSRNLRK